MYKLPDDVRSLTDYLKKGLPPDFDPLRDVRHGFGSNGFDVRWKSYPHFVTVLARDHPRRAVRVLRALIRDPLPSVLRVDLQYFLLTRVNSYEILENDADVVWEGLRQRALFKFKADCAIALAHLDADSALPEIEELLIETQHWIESLVRSGGIGYTELETFGRVCRAVNDLGSREGVATAIETLISPGLPILDHGLPGVIHPIVHALHLMTGKSIGPYYSMHTSDFQAEIGKWERWWGREKESFSVLKDTPLSKVIGRGHDFEPESLRDYLELSWYGVPDTTRGRYADEWPQYRHELAEHGSIARSWLSENGEAFVSEFLEIVLDHDESFLVRREALKWYVDFGRRESLPLLHSLVLAVPPGDSTPLKARRILSLRAFDLLKSQYPETLEARKLSLLESELDNVVLHAVALLKDHAEGLKTVGASFHRFSEESQRNTLEWLRDDDREDAEKIYFEGLKSDSVYVAARSASIIRNRNLEDRIPDDARDLLEEYEKDPLFLTMVSSWTMDDARRLNGLRLAASLGTTSERAPILNHAAVYGACILWLQSIDRFKRIMEDDPDGDYPKERLVIRGDVLELAKNELAEIEKWVRGALR